MTDCNKSIHIVPNNNQIELQNVNNTITVINYNCCTSVDVLQPVTSVVEILTGPMGKFPTEGPYGFTGSFSISGSLTTTGSIYGDIIYSPYFTGSFFGNGVGLFSGSFSGSVSSNLQEITDNGSTTTNAITSSGLLTNNVNVNGNVIVTGSLLVSGSNTFKNIGPAQFTGSTDITGSLSINGIDYEFTSASFDQRLLNNSSSIAYLSSSYLNSSASFDQRLLNTSSSIGLLSGSFLNTSSSLSIRVTNLENFSSSLDDTFATDAELNAATASLSSSIAYLSGSYLNSSASFNTRITNNSSSISILSSSFISFSSSYITDSASFNTRILNNSSSISILSSSFTGFSSSYVNDSSSFNTRILLNSSSIAAVSSSLSVFSGSYILDSASFDTRISSNSSSISTLSSSFNIFTQIYNTGSFTGSFTGSLFGTASWATNAQTSSYVLPLNQDVEITGSLNVSGSIDVTNIVNAFILSGSLHTDKISFTEQGTFTGVQGDLGYSFSDGKFTFYIENDVPIELGQTLYARVRNADSVVLTKGTVVDFTADTVGQTPRVKRAIATSGSDCSCFVGIILQDIGLNQFGAIMLNGVARGLNLTSFNTDDQLYLSSTISGSATTSIPTPPVKAIRIGKVLNASTSPTQGVLYVRPENRTVYFDLDQFKQTYNTGSFTGSFTGSLFGTSSQAISSSFTQTASFAPNYTLTSSFNTFTSSYNTGSFTGSFIGDGSGLYDIPASGIVGLNLSQITSGSVSASISPNNGLQVNTNITATSFTGSLFGTSSWAQNALTSSFALSGDGFFTGSFTGSFVGDGSQLTGIVSSKWSGSNPITRNSDVEITGSFKVSGQTTLYTTGSGTLRVQGSGSTQPLLLITGSVGELLSVIDQDDPNEPLLIVSGSAGQLFVVENSTTGSLLQIYDSSSNSIFEINNNAEILYGVSSSIFATQLNTIAATSSYQTIYNIQTGSYSGAFINYTVMSASNARAGQIMSVWNSGTASYTETTTTDIGNTSQIIFDIIMTGSIARVAVSSSLTTGWQVKTSLNIL